MKKMACLALLVVVLVLVLQPVMFASAEQDAQPENETPGEPPETGPFGLPRSVVAVIVVVLLGYTVVRAFVKRREK